MAAVRTKGYHLAVQICMWFAVFYLTPDSASANVPRLDPNNASAIIWGSLPPIPRASNTTNMASRPGTLADMAQGFVDLVQPQGLPYDYITFALRYNVYNQTDYYQDNWQTEMWKIMGLFVGIIVCLLIGILYIIIVPFTGLFFSYCRCCDNCGGKRLQRETKHMGCKRVMLSLIFFSITGIMCAGMAFTNVSNEFLKSSVEEFRVTAEATLGDLESYVTVADEQLYYMVNTEYGFLDQLLTDNLENIGTEIGDPVKGYLLTEAGLQGVVDSVTNISSTFYLMEEVLEEIDILRSSLIDDSIVLEEELDGVATDLTAVNNDVTCNNCVPNVDQLTVIVNFTQLPSVQMQVTGVEDANAAVINITNQINSVLDDIPAQITDMTSDSVQEALAQLDEAEKEINDTFSDISKSISDIANTLSSASEDMNNIWENEVTVYTQYVYYSLIGLTCTVLLIVMFNLIGLTMGTFSYKNVHPMERSRMSNAGGNVLMAGVFFTFFFAPLLMILTWVFFGIFSGISLTCGPLLTYELFNETIDQPNVIVEGYLLGDAVLQNGSIPLTITGILTECDNDASAYNAFMLQSLYDLDGFKDQLDQLRDEIDKLIAEIKPGDLNYDFPFTDFVDDLNELVAMTDLGQINYTQYETVLSANITGVDLNEYAADLNDIALNQTSDVATNLTAQAAALTRIQTDIVDPMQQNMAQIGSNLDLIKLLEAELDRQINQTIDAIAVAEAGIASNATGDAVVNISEAYANRIVDYGYQFYYQLEYQVTDDFARCKLVSSVYAYSINSVCDYAIASGNTFWFTVGWCVFFYVPSIIFAVKLAKYYRIMDEDAPYRAPKKSKKSKRETRRDSDEEVPMGDIEGTSGPDNIRLVDNGRPPSMMSQQNPQYVQDEPILAYNDLGRPMAPPPAYNPGYPKGAPPSLPPIHSIPQGGQPSGRPPSYTSGQETDNRQSINAYQYNQYYSQQF